MSELPLSYYVAVSLCFILLFVAAANSRKPWALPFAAVTGTIGAWYLIEPLYFPDLFKEFRFDATQTAYDSVSIFYVALLVLAPLVSRTLHPNELDSPRNLSAQLISANKIVGMVIGTWLVLLAFGTYRIGGDLIGALFPIESRRGTHMWARAAAADAGPGGFIVSFAGYAYTLCIATFGVLLFFVNKTTTKILLILLILVSWPYAFLQGARNVTMAVVVPSGLAFLLFGRLSRLGKLVVLVGGLIMLDLAMRVIISYRNTGFSGIEFSNIRETSHLGLNMASELVFITTFLEDGTLSLRYGARYLEELANIIPRAIWPNKPLIGIDYAIARGFGNDGASDIGVFATIHSGMIGQSVLNFGNYVGPVVASIVMGYWIGFLARLRVQGTPPRMALFLIGTGLTFNLGRDITFLVLWPMIFGYIGVRILEYLGSRRLQRLAISPQRRAP